MANLKEIRGRVSSISSTMQITNAMKMVSVAKLKKAQNMVSTFRPYANKLNSIIGAISENDGISSIYVTPRDVKKVLLIVITSNRGLAGAFNSSIIKETNVYIETNSNVSVEILTIGKKGFDAFKYSQRIYENCSEIYDSLTFENISAIMENIMISFKNKIFDEVHLIYNKFLNVATQEVQIERLLPISLDKSSDENKEVSDYILEPSRGEILDLLIPKSIKIQFYKAILDSLASEHGARMTAMHKATDNAQGLKNELAIFYNKARQTSITNEILEIVSGAEAMKNT